MSQVVKLPYNIRAQVLRSDITEENFIETFEGVEKGLGATEVPDVVHRFLSKMNINQVERSVEALGEMSLEDIETAITYLEIHSNYFFSQREINYCNRYVRFKKAFMYYGVKDGWNNSYRGRTAQLAHSQFLVPLTTYKEIVETHKGRRTEVMFTKQMLSEQDKLKRVELHCKNIEDKCEQIHSKEKMVESMIKNYGKCGHNGNLYFVYSGRNYTSGMFNFFNENGDKIFEHGELIQFDNMEEYFRKLLDGEIEDCNSNNTVYYPINLSSVKLLCHKDKVDELKDRLIDAWKELFQASKDYLEVRANMKELLRINESFLLE